MSPNSEPPLIADPRLKAENAIKLPSANKQEEALPATEAILRPANVSEKETSLTMRKCIVTGEVREKELLIRFIAAPDHSLVADVAGKLPGRGLWLTADRAILKEAIKKKSFLKASRQNLTLDPLMEEKLEQALLQRTIQHLSLARRAGEAIAGADKATPQIRKQSQIINQYDCKVGEDSAKGGIIQMIMECYPQGFQFLASDAGNDAVLKFGRKIELLESKPSYAMLFAPCRLLSADEMGQAFAKERTVHAFIKSGGLMRKLIGEILRLNGFRQSL